MQDTEDDHKQTADDIRDAVRKLNDVLKHAAQVGISVEIDTVRAQQFGHPVEMLILTAKIEMRKRL